MLGEKNNATRGHAGLNGSGCRFFKALCYVLRHLTILPGKERECGGGDGVKEEFGRGCYLFFFFFGEAVTLHKELVEWSARTWQFCLLPT